MSEMRIPSVLTVKPSSVIRSDYKRFSELCHATDDPVLITNNGENDLVVMSHTLLANGSNLPLPVNM